MPYFHIYSCLNRKWTSLIFKTISDICRDFDEVEEESGMIVVRYYAVRGLLKYKYVKSYYFTSIQFILTVFVAKIKQIMLRR